MQHARAHRDRDQRLAAAGPSLVIAAETTPTDDPGERSLHDPSSGQGAKAWREELLPIDLFAFGNKQPAFGNGERLDGLDGPSQRQLGPGAEGAAIVAVSPHQLETGKCLLQWLQ